MYYIYIYVYIYNVLHIYIYIYIYIYLLGTKRFMPADRQSSVSMSGTWLNIVGSPA